MYAVGTTFTPTAYSTGAFVKLGDEEWEKIGGRDKFLPATLGISGPDEQQPGRHPVGQPAVRDGLQHRPAQGGRHRQAGDHLGRAGPAGQAADQGRPVRPGGGLQGQLRPVEVHLGHGGAGRQPAGRRQDGPARRPDRQEGVPDLLRLAGHRQGGRPGRRRLDERAGDRRVRQGQDRLPARWSRPRRQGHAGQGRGQGQVRLRAAADRAARRDQPARRTGSRPRSILSGDNLLVAEYSKNKDLAFAVRQADHRPGRPAGLLQEVRRAAGERRGGADAAVGPEAGRGGRGGAASRWRRRSPAPGPTSSWR